MKQCTQSGKACTECPFSRNSTSGNLGGSPIEVYLGQILGAFYLPCHMAKNYKGNDTPLLAEHMQCAGAAIFRRHIGIADRIPDPLLKLDTDDGNVFTNLAEFIQHHDPELPEAMVKRMVSLANRGYYTQLEMMRAMITGKDFKTSEQAVADYKKGGSDD